MMHVLVGCRECVTHVIVLMGQVPECATCTFNKVKLLQR